MIPEEECIICGYVNEKKPKKKKGFWGRLVEEPEPQTIPQSQYKPKPIRTITIGGVKYNSWDEVPDDCLKDIPLQLIDEEVRPRAEKIQEKHKQERARQSKEAAKKQAQEQKEMLKKLGIKNYFDVNEIALDLLFDNYSGALPEKIHGEDPTKFQYPEEAAIHSFYRLELENARKDFDKIIYNYKDQGDKAFLTFFDELLEEPELYRKIAGAEAVFFNSIQSMKKGSKQLDRCNEAIKTLKVMEEAPDNNLTVFNLINGLINEMLGVLAWNFDRDIEKAVKYMDEACDSYYLIADALRLERAGYAAHTINFCHEPEYYSSLEVKALKYAVSTGELPYGEFTYTTSFSWNIVRFASIYYTLLRIQEYLGRNLEGFRGIYVQRMPTGTKITLKLLEPEAITDQKREELEKIFEDSYKYEHVMLSIIGQEAEQ